MNDVLLVVAHTDDAVCLVCEPLCWYRCGVSLHARLRMMQMIKSVSQIRCSVLPIAGSSTCVHFLSSLNLPPSSPILWEAWVGEGGIRDKKVESFSLLFVQSDARYAGAS